MNELKLRPDGIERLASGRPGRGMVAVLAVVSSFLVSSCSGLVYVPRTLWGGAKLLAGQRPIARLVADPRTEAALRERLETVLEIREFAVSELGLPDNGSYRRYKRLGREAAAWTVVAAPELSVEPVVWCFPIAGCVSYRGYFSRRRAEAFAARLARRGFDVEVGAVDAFSTLGRLRDPVLSTFVDRPDPRLAALLFHELAHQRVWARDDTAFNESFATVVERAGVRRWLAATGRPGLDAYLRAEAREEERTRLLLAYREKLAAAYAAPEPVEWKRCRKRELFVELEAECRRLSAATCEGAAGLNNARLASVAAYGELVPALERLLEHERGDLEAFYRQAAELARLDSSARRARLEALIGPTQF